MTKQTLDSWYKLYKQLDNGYHLSESDMRKLIFLNYEVMSASHRVHNGNMLNSLDSAL